MQPRRELIFVNQQRAKSSNRRKLHEVTEAALAELPGVSGWNLTFHLVGARKMAEINERHLGHRGPTDVITFDYADHPSRQPQNTGTHLLGEIFICIDVAVSQAREFRTTWQSEVVGYIIHALLHLCGHDDLATASRRRMKTVENKLVRKLARRFALNTLGHSAG